MKSYANNNYRTYIKVFYNLFLSKLTWGMKIFTVSFIYSSKYYINAFFHARWLGSTGTYYNNIKVLLIINTSRTKSFNNCQTNQSKLLPCRYLRQQLLIFLISNKYNVSCSFKKIIKQNYSLGDYPSIFFVRIVNTISRTIFHLIKSLKK